MHRSRDDTIPLIFQLLPLVNPIMPKVKGRDQNLVESQPTDNEKKSAYGVKSFPSPVIEHYFDFEIIKINNTLQKL